SVEMGITLFNLGNLHLRNGELPLALENLNRALEIRRASGELATQAMILTAISNIRVTEGDPDAALALLAQALDICRQQQDRLFEANVLQNIARIHLLRGELQKALELFVDTRDLYQALGALGPKAQVLSNLGTTALRLGDDDQALEYYTEALEIHRAMKNTTWEAYALWDIGAIHESNAPEVSLEHYNRALELGRAEGNRPVEALALLGIGRARLALGHEEAVRHLEDALALFRSTGNTQGEISTILELGRASQALSGLDRAAELFRQALTLSRQRQTLNSEAMAQAAVARLERDRGNLPAALEAGEAALRIIETMRPKVASQRLRVSFLASNRDYYELYIDIRMRMNEADPGGGHLEAALAASERARARGLLDLLAEGRIDVRQGIAAELKQRETEIGRRISWLQTRLIQELSGQKSQGGAAPVADIETELSRSEEELERLEWQIRREHPRYAAVSHPSPLPLARIQELLDDRTALLEFSVGKERSFLFVVTRAGMAGFPLPPADELAGLVETFRQAVAEPGRRLYGRYLDTAYQLYRTLIEPAEPLLKDKPRLILSLEGPLLLLSFEALLTSEVPTGDRRYATLPYLILDRSVTYIPSASVLAELGRPRPAAAGEEDAKLFLGFGSPDYGAPRQLAAQQPASISAPAGSLEQSFRDAGLPNPQALPNARQEVTSIAQLYPQDQVVLYVGQQASEENVKNNPFLKTARQLHFAVHGFLHERQPELSGLVLTLDGDDREDGLLQVYEVFNLELQADLVVLSACDTGLGKNVSGEGLLGVTRALLYAGAASVAVSLWQVADTSTSDLMVRFYQHLSRSGDKAEALRLSKLEMIREGQFDRPYFWAPFILIGQPDQVDVTSSLPSRP
ncbi:MAG TPA: CHAT domain-containing tetratricopeptide repeat protein, partial [Thermoanaerobaculia bacterium]|nr:CHAT domain-containing tetratricopeptide repeat protein [Thermoanaerobaculia bacterium]